MKNKKFLIGVFVMVALLCLGVGYAAVTKTLKVTGTAQTVSTDELQNQIDAYFTSFQDTTTDTFKDRVKVTSDTNYSSKPKTANFSVTGFQYVGDTATFTCTIYNASPWTIEIDFDIINNQGFDEDGTDTDFTKYFEVTTSNHRKIVAGGSSTITFSIKLIKVPETQKSLNFSISSNVELA